MRRLILLAACVCAFSSNAQAQSILGTGGASEWGQLSSWATQRLDNARQLQQLIVQYRMIENTYRAVSGARDIGSLVGALGDPARTYLPQSTPMLDLIGTGASMVGGAGSIRGADGIFRAVNGAVRGLEGFARWTKEMERSEVTTANVKAMAQNGLIDMQSRMLSLRAAQARIGMAVDMQDLLSVQATIQTQQVGLQAHQISLQNMQLMLHAADRTEAARERQIAAESSQKWADATRGAVDRLQGN